MDSFLYPNFKMMEYHPMNFTVNFHHLFIKTLVAKNLYMLSSYRDTIFNRILATDVMENKRL